MHKIFYMLDCVAKNVYMLNRALPVVVEIANCLYITHSFGFIHFIGYTIKKNDVV